MRRIKTIEFVISCFLIIIVGCSTNKFKVHYPLKYDNGKIKKPDFINNPIILQKIISKNDTNYYWIEFGGSDSILKHNHCFKIYDINGKLLRKYYYFLINSKKYKKSKLFFERYHQSPFIDSIGTNGFSIIGNWDNKVLISNDEKYYMKEYFPRGISPKNKNRKQYYEWIKPNNIPKHSVLVEDTETDFLYKWHAFIDSELISDNKRIINMMEYSYEGQFLRNFSFICRMKEEVNLNNYSFLKSLFVDESIFLNNGKEFKMKDAN